MTTFSRTLNFPASATFNPPTLLGAININEPLAQPPVTLSSLPNTAQTLALNLSFVLFLHLKNAIPCQLAHAPAKRGCQLPSSISSGTPS